MKLNYEHYHLSKFHWNQMACRFQKRSMKTNKTSTYTIKTFQTMIILINNSKARVGTQRAIDENKENHKRISKMTVIINERIHIFTIINGNKFDTHR